MRKATLGSISKGKRSRGYLAKLVSLAKSEPVAACGTVLLLCVGAIFFVQPRPSAEAAKAHTQLPDQSLLTRETDDLVAEVAELARELEEAQHGDEGALTLRERLWKEKEAARDEEEGGGDGEGGVDPSNSGGGRGGWGQGSQPLPQQLEAFRQKQQEGWGQQLEQQAQQLLEPRQALPRPLGGLGSARRAYELAVQLPPPRPDPEVVVLSKAEEGRRRQQIVGAMDHAWGGYVRYAWGHDELAPVSKEGKDGFGGLGATIIDSLDTLLMMGMRGEYERALAWISTEMHIEAAFEASVFETIIRVVGGFLAAHEVTGDEVLLQKSEAVAQRILPAYNTSTGIPFNSINLKTQEVKNPKWNMRASTLAEFGTHQLEFYKLSQKTGNSSYQQLAEATIKFLYENSPTKGLMPLFVHPTTGKFTHRKVSFGALGDSYYEYLIKLWVIKGRPEGDFIRDMWEQAMDEMIDRLLFTSKEGLQYIAEFDRFSIKHKMDHLGCFIPGMLALGVYHQAVTGRKAERYMQVAENVTHTCWKMYHTQPTGLSPEYVTFTSQGMRVGAPYNMLRPEALEAFWYMWRMTRDEKYRTWAWEVFQAFQLHCKMEAGYSGLKDVRRLNNITHDDTQQSFFLAETLKYLYLIFSPDESLDWDLWVLNTEAHPLKIVQGGRKAKQKTGPWVRGVAEKSSWFSIF